MRYAVVTFYDWKDIDHGMLTRARIDRAFVERYAITAMEEGLNLAAQSLWEPVTTTFVPGIPGQDDPRRAADKLVIIMRNAKND